MHEVLVNGLGGLSLPRKSVVRLTDRPDMTLDVYRGRKTTIQQQQQNSMTSCLFSCQTKPFLKISTFKEKNLKDKLFHLKRSDCHKRGVEGSWGGGGLKMKMVELLHVKVYRFT